MGVCGSRATAGPAADAADAADAAAEAAEAERLRRAQADDDEAMEQALALSLVMAGGDGGAAAAADPPAALPPAHSRIPARPTTAGGREEIPMDMLLHVFWDPAWDASESALRRGGTAYWSSAVLSVLGPSEWISAHPDPHEDSHSVRQVRARILRNHPTLLDAAAWEGRTYLGLDAALGVPDDARMGPGVAGLPPHTEPAAGSLTRRSSRAATAIGTKAEDLKGMIAAHVRQCGSASGAETRTVIVERDDPLQSLVNSSALAQVRCCDAMRVDFRNEPGNDDGGITRDFFTTLMHAYVGCGRYEGTLLAAQLFTHTEDNGYVYRINPQSSVLGADADRLFEAFGWLLARALVDSVLLDVHFQPAFYKSLLSEVEEEEEEEEQQHEISSAAAGCELADLEACDKKLYDSLTELLAMPEDEVELVCYTFSIPVRTPPAKKKTRHDIRFDFCRFCQDGLRTKQSI
jgi:hypothetical protein